MFDGVGDEVAQDALDAAAVDVDRDVVRRVEHEAAAELVGELRVHVVHLGAQLAHRRRCAAQHGAAGVESADLEQVREQRLEAVELLRQQFGRTRDVRREVAA